MSKRKVSKISTRDNSESSQDEESDSDDERIVIPDRNYSGSDGDFSSDDKNAESESSFPNVSYWSIFDSYTETKKKLEPDHTFSWNTGEKFYPANLDDQILLSDDVQRKISSMSDVELFELFFF